MASGFGWEGFSKFAMNSTMKMALVVGVLALLLARVAARSNKALGRGSRWRLLIGMAAVLVVLLILMNPEFLGLGLLGDTAFFDLLLLGVSLQLETILGHVFRFGVWIYSKVRWWILARSVGMISILLAVDAVGEKVSEVQKFLGRLR